MIQNTHSHGTESVVYDPNCVIYDRKCIEFIYDSHGCCDFDVNFILS